MGQANGKEKADGGVQTVDGGALVPQGVYSGAQDYNHAVVKGLIQARRLAAFYTGLDDEESYAQAPFNTECPICFLYYPSPLNHTRCCSQPICTECFVQIKRADPTTHNPPSSEPAMCPYCQETDFGIVYKAPPPGVMSGEVKNAAGVAESASAARQQAEGSAEGSLQQQQAAKKRKSFGADDPSVVTIDTIRPDWQAKLIAAEAATLRRANRRIIMRQVGDRLIPIGVSSSRLGAELPPGSTTGPGGAIIIGENTRWGFSGGSSAAAAAAAAASGGDRRGSARGRRGGELAQFLQSLGGGPDMEEMMMMEAMRLSLLEHEEQQRRQSQAQSQEAAAGTTAADAASTTTEAQSVSQQLQQAPLPRSSSLSSDIAGAPTTSTVLASAHASPSHRAEPPPTPAQLGISSSMMSELAELVDGGLPGVQSREERLAAAAAAAAPVSISASTRAAPATSSPFMPSSPSARLTSSTSAAHSPTNTPPVGSPSRIGANPNNPFRRMAGSAATSPTHSRQGSVANLGAARNVTPSSQRGGAPPS